MGNTFSSLGVSDDVIQMSLNAVALIFHIVLLVYDCKLTAGHRGSTNFLQAKTFLRRTQPKSDNPRVFNV